MTRYEQIIEFEKRLLSAMKTGNTRILDELIHDDLIFNIPTGQTVTKEIDLNNYRSGIMKVSEIATTDQIIHSFGETYAVAVTLHLNAKYGDQVIKGKFRYLRVWKLFGESWKVIAGSGFKI